MNQPRPFNTVVLLVIVLLFMPALSQAGMLESDESMIAHGHYIVTITGCNDCHTPGYVETEGKLPIDQWLTGSTLGWRGPWGTTYAPNLRIFAAALNEDQWVTTIQTLKRRPPMPWFTLNQMTEHDMRAVYRFIRSLGDVGEPAPAFIPPEQEPPPPYVTFPAPPPTKGD